MSKSLIFISKFALIFILFEMTVLGLFAYKVDTKTHRAGKSPFRLIYCTLAGLGGFSLYLWVALKLLADPGLEYITEGVAYYTIILRNVFSFLLIIIFYGFQIYKRNYYIKFLNDLNETFNTFGLFYAAQSIDINALDRDNSEALQEIDHVFKPLFYKGIVCHVIVLNLKLLMAYYLQLSSPETSMMMLTFYLAYPYVLQSATSSYMLLGLRKSTFLYVAMAQKLREIHAEVRKLAKDKAISSFGKMKRYCELSDQIDSLGISFDRITKMAMELSETYHIHMLLILGYTVSNNLTLFFQQYIGLARGILDYRLMLTEVGFILLSLFEILLIISSVDEGEKLFKKVLQEVHLINYWQRTFDCRLRQSLETFSHIAAGYRFDMSLYKMHKLNLPLALGIFDATFSYFLIMIQFDMAHKRGELH